MPVSVWKFFKPKLKNIFFLKYSFVKKALVRLFQEIFAIFDELPNTNLYKLPNQAKSIVLN